ncbi:MAG: vWA domain-containing protein [Bacteriovorax sp.]
MLLTLVKRKQTLLLACVLLLIGACKQSEFYDKSQVLDPTKATGSNPGPDSGTPVQTDNNTGGNDGGMNGGSTTQPPVVIAPPPVIVNPPVVVAPPVVVDPPVAVNPPVVVDPPVAVTPPVVTPPVVVTPPPVVVSPPVVVTPPPVIADPPIAVNLTERSEIFTQDSTRNGDVDILWVIDDSGSMADNQDALARNFNQFITQFLDRKIDFKMAITTTDGTSTRNGKMVGDSSMLTRASATGNRTAFTNNFTKWVKVGTSGSGIEQGLKCASSFLDRYSSSFLREDAYLAIVFLSDEDDQSEKKVSEYLARFQAAKKNKGMVKTYSIVTEKLPANARWESVGKRYIEVSKATGGTDDDITDDFAGTLKDLGGSILNLIDRFALAESPYDNNITVLVNNVQVNSGWSFDAATHSLKFNAGSVPAEGAKIEVRYKVKATVLGAI